MICKNMRDMSLMHSPQVHRAISVMCHVFAGWNVPLAGHSIVLQLTVRGTKSQLQAVHIAQRLTRSLIIRPEKKRQAAFSGMSGVGGAGRESPIGDDDNEEVRQRALNLVFRFHTNFDH